MGLVNGWAMVGENKDLVHRRSSTRNAAPVPDGGVLVCIDGRASAKAAAVTWAGEAVRGMRDPAIVLIARPRILVAHEVEAEAPVP